MQVAFDNRADAGRQLARALHKAFPGNSLLPREWQVLALPRGGIPVAEEVARYFKLPLDVLIVRKVGLPFHPELAMGAIASGGVTITNPEVMKQAGISRDQFEREAERERIELNRREQHYRKNREPLAPAGKSVILVDDGIATGSTVRAAVAALKQLRVKTIVLATPTAPPETLRAFQNQVDDIVCVHSPDDFLSVGNAYRDFRQTTDEEVMEILSNAETA